MALTTGNIEKRRFFTTAVLYATFGFVFCISLHLSDKISLRLLSTDLNVFS